MWLLLGLGGAAGAMARYAVATSVQRHTGPGFPWGTLTVNVIGSFALGVVLAAIDQHPARPLIVALVASGFLGDFTTFSTFAYEIAALGHARAWGRAVAYLFGSVAATLFAVAAGLAMGSAL